MPRVHHVRRAARGRLGCRPQSPLCYPHGLGAQGSGFGVQDGCDRTCWKEDHWAIRFLNACLRTAVRMSVCPARPWKPGSPHPGRGMRRCRVPPPGEPGALLNPEPRTLVTSVQTIHTRIKRTTHKKGRLPAMSPSFPLSRIDAARPAILIDSEVHPPFAHVSWRQTTFSTSVAATSPSTRRTWARNGSVWRNAVGSRRCCRPRWTWASPTCSSSPWSSSRPGCSGSRRRRDQRRKAEPASPARGTKPVAGVEFDSMWQGR